MEQAKMDCFFCGEKETVMVEPESLWGTFPPYYRTVCGHCGAQGHLVRTEELAQTLWLQILDMLRDAQRLKEDDDDEDTH